jgi:lipoyl synthase
MSEAVFVRLDSMHTISVPGSLEQAYAPDMQKALDRAFALRREHFPDEITFHAPGLRRYKTAEYTDHDHKRFVSISLTGAECALACDHCNMSILKSMAPLPGFGGSLFDMCSELARQGAGGVLISGGSNKKGRVPLLKHIPDLVRVQRELGMTIRVHPGIPDEETVAGLAEVGIDGAMMDIIGENDTIRDVYHLVETTTEDYERALALLDRYDVPSLPHIILGLHYGQMRGEHKALEMIARHRHKAVVLVILMPLSDAPMARVTPPPVEEIMSFFAHARMTLPESRVMLGCARPAGRSKLQTDRAAVDAGFNGIAYPAEGIITYARQRGLQPKLINACCGVQW